MNKLVLKYLLCFLFASYISVISQIKIHKSLTTADGLISGEIYRMMQDSKGYIWFATSDGASKWDGTNFENFHLNNGLTSSQVFFIEEGFNDEIFLATFGTGVTVYNNGKIDTLNQKNGFPSNYITVIHRSKNGGVYFCAEDIIFLYKNGKYTNWSSQYQIRLFGVVNILETSDSSIFIATTNGLVRIKNESIKTFYKKDGLKHNSITGIAEGLDGTIHIGTMGGINRYRNDIFSGLQLQGKEINDNIYEVIVSKDGTVYYMSSNGVIVNSNNNVQRLQEWNGLSNNHVWSALEDRSGNLYFGTSGYGVSIYSPDKIDNFNSSHGLGNTNITSLVEDNLKQLIVGTENGLFIKEVNSIVFESFNKKFSGVAITSLFKSSEDKIYIGTKTGITIATQKENGNYKIELEKNIGKISSIKEDISQNIIVGTESGVKVFLPKSFKEIKPDIKLSNYFINALLVTKDSSVIYGYHGKGLTINKNNKLFHYDESNGLTNGIINSLCERRDGSIWIGTQQGGLYILDNGGIRKFERTDELLSNTIYGIVEDDLENLFVSTPKGVNILVKKGEDFFIRTLTKDDGLVSDACNRNALVKDKNGKIWIGTKDGLTHFDPTKDSNSFIPPVIYFTNFSIYNTPYGLEYLNDVPQLNYDENYLTLSYRSINLSSPKKIIYYYHLKGVDKNWITTENNSIMFSNLDDGSYTLEIKCKNEWDQFSKTIEANFVINPAWWETWWFYFLTLLAITSFITFIVSSRYRNLLAVERIRTKISEDLHDNIGSGLSQISILTELMNLQLKDEKSEFKEHLKKVNSISASLVENMSDIVWLINPKRNSLKELILRLRDSYNEILEFSQIDFDIENLDSLEEIHLSINYRQHLYLILKEAVNNSIKYSKADLLKIDINVKKNFLNICYSDNGKGFDITKVKYGNGIKNIKKRAADIGAKLDYFSEIGKGTKITFSGRI